MSLATLTRRLAVMRPLSRAVEQRVATQAPALRAVPTEVASLPIVLPRLGRLRAATPSIAQVPLSPRGLSFVVLVVIPIAVAATYYFAIAADQYVAEFRFSLNTIERTRFDPLALLGGNATHSPAAAESQIVVQYLASRAAVDEIGGALDLRRLFSPPQADWWARLSPSAPIEELVRYWQGQVDPSYDPANGTVMVRARGFAPADALRLAQAIVTACERLVNDLSLRARRDTLEHAEIEVGQAEARLKTALADIRAFRDREGLIDPVRTAEGTGLLTTRLRDELVKANSELSTLKAYMRDDAPPVKVLKARIRSLEAQRRSLAQEMTDPDPARPDTLSRILGSYEQLESERKFAEGAYQHALQSLDQARVDADRQHVFIASFVPPSLPEEALYPRRWRSLGTVAMVVLALWGIGGLTVQSVRDHLA